MKKTVATLAFAALTFCLVGCSGCKSKIQVIHNGNVVTNTVPVKAFNDESYVWEGWKVSTNKVNKVDK